MNIYDVDAIQKWDQATIAQEPISSLDLMERAASIACEHLVNHFEKTPVHIFCGPGNNGGDGLVMARLLHQKGWKVQVYLVDLDAESSPDNLANLKQLPVDIPKQNVLNTIPTLINTNELILDCIFGSGLNRPIMGNLKELTQKINVTKATIIAIDIPSGLFATNNEENDFSAIIQAKHTLTFQVPKMSFFFAKYEQFVGQFHILDIGLSREYNAPHLATYIQHHHVQLKPIPTHAHKGNNGYLCLIAGLDPMQGAGVLSAKAAYRMGCGYVGWLTSKKSHIDLLKVIPEALLLQEIAPKSTAVAIGPGLGFSEEATKWVQKALSSDIPLVIDADAINIIASYNLSIPKGAILTPHLKELERLIGKWKSPEECLNKQKAFAIKNGVYLLQKGAFSKICTPEGRVYVNSTGNANMSKAGMGDTLTGMIGSLLAQGYSAQNSLVYGVYLHGLAGDITDRKMGKSLIPSDVCESIPEAIAEVML